MGNEMSALKPPRWILQSLLGVLVVLGLNTVFSAPESFGPQQATYCKVGFQLVDGKCLDIDECATENGGCGEAKCGNVEGGWRCGVNCPPGFTGTPATGCVDINECTSGNGGCDRLTLCRNTLGSRTCSPCPEDHVGDGLVGCFDVNESKNAPDTRAPGIAIPGSMTVTATSAEGIAVKYAASALDFTDGPRPVSCAPASGSTFPVGATKVTCTSTDAAGNSATKTFTITVVAPAAK
jgi:HYR domain-containing protein/EGF domain-containing protein